MAALLHQSALPAAKPWALNPTPRLSLPPLSRRRRRAPEAIRSAATDNSIGAGAAPSEKRTTRKEKQEERRRQQDLQHRQEQLLRMEEASSFASSRTTKPDGNSNSGEKRDGVDNDDDEELPQPVFDRILRRIMFAVGVPMASGVALLHAYDALKRGQGVEVPAWVSLLTILLAFGTSALGIAYGTLSASWDPDKEGSLLGIDEARANWPVLWQEEIEKEKAKAKQRKK